MAKYKSLVEIHGTIDNLVFYNLNGIPVVRRKSGFNKNDFEKNPKYAKVRENSGEFGHCSKSGKMIRTALQDYLQDCGDRYLYQKFAQVMTQIKDLDRESPRGQRTIAKGLQHEGAYGLLYRFRFGIYEGFVGTAARSEGLFGTEIKIKNPGNYDALELVILKPDYETYMAESTIIKQSVLPKQTLYEFEKAEEPGLLYFLVLKKAGKILNIGFI